MSMFCFQCQETARNQGCTVRGVCGKAPETANKMDELIRQLKIMAQTKPPTRALGLFVEDMNLLSIQSKFHMVTCSCCCSRINSCCHA